LTAASFTYDPLGQRVNKTINGAATRFSVGWPQSLAGTFSSAATANLFTGFGIDEYLTRTDSSGTRSYLGDGLGSTRALVDNTGTVQRSYTYEPFDNTIISGTAGTNTFQYTGRGK
jgi:hypothetical protein